MVVRAESARETRCVESLEGERERDTEEVVEDSAVF